MPVIRRTAQEFDPIIQPLLDAVFEQSKKTNDYARQTADEWWNEGSNEGGITGSLKKVGAIGAKSIPWINPVPEDMTGAAMMVAAPAVGSLVGPAVIRGIDKARKYLPSASDMTKFAGTVHGIMQKPQIPANVSYILSKTAAHLPGEAVDKLKGFATAALAGNVVTKPSTRREFFTKPIQALRVLKDQGSQLDELKGIGSKIASMRKQAETYDAPLEAVDKQIWKFRDEGNWNSPELDALYTQRDRLASIPEKLMDEEIRLSDLARLKDITRRISAGLPKESTNAMDYGTFITDPNLIGALDNIPLIKNILNSEGGSTDLMNMLATTPKGYKFIREVIEPYQKKLSENAFAAMDAYTKLMGIPRYMRPTATGETFSMLGHEIPFQESPEILAQQREEAQTIASKLYELVKDKLPSAGTEGIESAQAVGNVMQQQAKEVADKVSPFVKALKERLNKRSESLNRSVLGM